MIRELIADKLASALDALGVEATGVSVEYIEDPAFGDISTNAAMVGAKAKDVTPRALAEELIKALGDIEGVEKMEVAGPGFINFTVTPWILGAILEGALDAGGEWGKNLDRMDEVIMFEYTSPNLFKPLHVGNLVGNIVGESITRLLSYAGADIKRINYPSDIGLTVAKGVWGLLQSKGDAADIAALGEAYKEGNDAYENDESAKKEIEEVNRKLYDGSDEKLNALRAAGIATSRAQLEKLCRMLGTTFDTEIFESEASMIGRDLVLAHIADGIFEVSDGATIFAGERHGLHTRVFLNSQGLPTYEAKDLGNFKLKQDAYPDWTRSIVVTGAEQKDYFKVIIAAIKEVFPEARDKAIEHIGTGFLTLTTGKMSSRKGNVLTGESILADLEESARERAIESRATDKEQLTKDIAVAALKYQILRQGVGSDIIFDRERALSLEGDSGPYIQYAYARACSVIAAAREAGVTPVVEAPQTGDERAIARLLLQFPEVIMRAQESYEPHHVATYAAKLAGLYNGWYAREHVIGTDAAGRRTAITHAVAITLRNALYLLGIEAPMAM
jgi:arginyl-tRNA synthetase